MEQTITLSTADSKPSVPVLNSTPVYGSNYDKAFETTDLELATLHDFVHSRRATVEQDLITSGRFSADSRRLKGAVDKFISMYVRITRGFVEEVGEEDPAAFRPSEMSQQQWLSAGVAFGLLEWNSQTQGYECMISR